MDRRPRVATASVAATFLTALALALVVGLPARQAGAQVTPPNVIFIMLDDAGYADFGATGSTFIQTPRIDAFALEGTTMTSYYPNAPLCGPTRIALLTGEYSAKMWMRDNGNSSVVPGTLTLPQLLSSAGYVTGHVGKWHVEANDSTDYTPLTAGFDLDVRFKSILATTPSYFEPIITINNTEVVTHTGEHLTEVLTDYAIDFVEDNATSTFFLQLWHWAPHSPLEPPLDWAALYPDTDEGRVGAMISDADEQTGRLLDTLDALGIADNTLVFITSDNGGVVRTHDGNDPSEGPSNAPFRGNKAEVWEGGIHVPLFTRWPDGGIVPGATNDSVTVGMDLIHTLAELAGVDTSSLGLPGTSMVAALQGQLVPRVGPIFWERKAHVTFFSHAEGIFDNFAVRDGDWKLVREQDPLRLYDIANDPGEAVDLASSFPTVVDDLVAANQVWRRETGLVPHAIGTITGDVVIDEDVWTFNGGAVDLAHSIYYDVRRKDFSFLASITPSSGAPDSKRVIAKKDPSWELVLLRNNILRLRVFDSTGSQTVLRSTQLTRDQRHDVAFTFFGWEKGGTSVRLYLDGVLQAETFEIADVRAGTTTPIRIGNTGSLARPFLGVFENLGIFSPALRPYEIDDYFAGL